MKNIIRIVLGAVVGVAALGATQASASGPAYYQTVDDKREYRGDDYYERDDYKRSRAYRGDNYNRYDRRSRGYYKNGVYYDRRGDNYYRGRGYDRNRGYDRRRRGSKVVSRSVIPARGRANIVVVEEIYYTRSGREQLICTVKTRGPDANYVPYDRVRRVARRCCSRYADIRIRG